MKKMILEYKASRWLFPVLVIGLSGVLYILGNAGVLCAAGAVSPADGGVIRTGEDNSVAMTRTDVDQLILDEIDKKVQKIRPVANPLDTISRYISDIKRSSSQVVRHYAIDVLPPDATVFTAITEGNIQVVLQTSNNDMFSVDETVMVENVYGFKEDGVTVANEYLVLYIVEKDASGGLIVRAVNGETCGNIENTIPAISKGTKLIRMGRAGSEDQITTPAYASNPTPTEQYLQKFMAQVEETTLRKMAETEVEWNFTDMEEESLYDMKSGMNRSFWLGVKRVRRYPSKKGKDTYFTGGIWWQAGKQFEYGVDADNLQFDEKMLVELMKVAFTGNAGSRQKVWICGSDLIENLEKIEYVKIIRVGASHQAYGLVFDSIKSKFGVLWVVHDESLDSMGFAKCGMIIDTACLRKWTMGWRVENHDLVKASIRDADSRWFSEICGLVLRNPKAHVIVIPTK